MGRYVGLDLHRRRSVIVVLDESGERLWSKRIENDPVALAAEISRAGPSPRLCWRRRGVGIGRRM